MSVKTKKGFKKISKVIAVALFALLMFANIKVSTMSATDISQAGFKIFGFEIIQNNIFAKQRRAGACGDICYIVPNSVCTYIVEYGFCDGKMG